MVRIVSMLVHALACNNGKFSRNICDKLLHIMKPEKAGMLHTGSAKVLNAPVHLATMAANLENNIEEIKSIWVMSRDDGLVS